jgi:hypothetical protein
MMSGRRNITAFFAVLACTVSVYADMIPMPIANSGCGQLPYIPCGRTDLRCVDLSGPFHYYSVADLDLWPAGLLSEKIADTGQTPELQNLRSLTDGPGSFALCLYALMGLGLFRSAPWVKKISFQFIPEWYHDGGPFQIGHSHAVTPENLYPAPAYCFVQPACMVGSLIPKYSQRIIVSLWRKSQFTPDVIASRGPPDMS